MLFTRLLPLLCLLSLSSPALSQHTKTQAVPERCAVTNPLEHPFVPPRPYLASSGVNWFGTDRLWTFLPSDGIWGQGEKTFWFREEWGRYQGSDQRIPAIDTTKFTVAARRLDGPAPPPEVDQASNSYREEDWKAFLVGGINFPTPGCWEVWARYENDELTFVVWVVRAAPKRQTQEQAVPLSIVVDKSCLIQPESDPLVLGDHIDAFHDDAICHLRACCRPTISKKRSRTASAPASLSVLPSRNTSCKIRLTSLPSSPSSTSFRRIGRWTPTRNPPAWMAQQLCFG